ncbi:cellulose biosynthesis cyclic di-GMP-binding regulatory protein BcsB [Nodosilinea sp. E11]|uniref:cellulose biosynthesis cyclic di-GMP-binding regulatory protein BcsB n=1 Tax=Nodosilinea sp. E11 TaxID=3037479 RepID=UPI002934F43C|nr:cellulose biosynthesis cyclic di-GMP-binding regulatory protein BcsB [Nodosilinea sp. E11]WOD38621.1 cellulose biosynthesis cyclic di-GMP-binding regulatory protein BcsB [Nodosilinea sp. E11]
MRNWLVQLSSFKYSFQYYWRARWRSLRPWFLGLGGACLIALVGLLPALAQTSDAVKQQEDSVIQQYSLPRSTPPAPVVRPPSRPPSPAARPAPAPAPQRSTPAPPSRPAAPPASVTSPAPAAPPTPTPAVAPEPEPTPAAPALSQYILQFNRSPVVGNALQMQGILSQARLGFTRPRHWQVESAKIQIRYRQSPALYADRSNLTVRLNNRHLGSVPLNRDADEIGNLLFDIPADLVEDFNTVIMEVQQHTSADCTDPNDPTLWTEILPDSQVVLNYRPQAIALDLSNYPYPFLDRLGLEADRLTYLRPKTVDNLWLTASGRYQAAASRLSNGRPLQTRLVDQLEQLKGQDRLVIIGTPAEQPALANLELPFALDNNQVLDGSGAPLPNGVGVLMLTTAANGEVPVLVATGNDSGAVLKAVQALVQPGDRQLLTGQAALVNQVADIPSPDPRDWPGYLPKDARQLLLGDLTTQDNQLFQDVTVNGLPVPPPVEIPLRSLPDEQMLRGSKFTLRYSYGPGIDPRRSSVSVMLNGQGIGGERLRSANGGTDSVTVDLPLELITPTSNLAVQFYTFPNVAISCGALPDQPMWGTVHSNSSLDLNRANVVQLPDLKRLQTGFPLTAPQDLSQTSFVLPASPSNDDILTLLQVSGRLGRLSQAQSVKLGAYLADGLSTEARQQNLVAIGLQSNFPLPEVNQSGSGLVLRQQFGRQLNQTQMQTFSDQAGIIQAQVSPWNNERLLVGLMAQQPAGLTEVQQVFQEDALFSRLAGDTAIVQRTTPNPSIYNQADYQIVTLSQQPTHTVDRRGPITRAVAFLQANWILLPGGMVMLALLLYGLSQLFLNRLSRPEGIS